MAIAFLVFFMVDCDELMPMAYIGSSWSMAWLTAWMNWSILDDCDELLPFRSFWHFMVKDVVDSEDLPPSFFSRETLQQNKIPRLMSSSPNDSPKVYVVLRDV